MTLAERPSRITRGTCTRASQSTYHRESCEAIFYGVRCAIIHPGYTDTAMVRALGDDFVRDRILPQTQLKRLVQPEEIAHAISFMIRNSTVSGSLWADAGWHPIA